MEREVYLDTHVVVWLFVGQADRLSEAAISYVENSQVLISSMVRLELTYLFEVKRIQAAPDMILASLGKEINLLFRDSPFPDLINRALDKDWTRDPFDRLIVSQAELNSCPLITKDATIRKHFKGAIW